MLSDQWAYFVESDPCEVHADKGQTRNISQHTLDGGHYGGSMKEGEFASTSHINALASYKGKWPLRFQLFAEPASDVLA